ncbi:hypothetical protein [Sphingobacterium bovistauri]|uniref:Leucine-rich repeat domain-containing protein n=1 Tax=Sphingobacterium bovistauri TaxID=2781959 RepID=A0ABS7Z6M1_9SPHI|nr:hypothetical protein [Sphingobacterium bovistauri]MCA5005252.1 hypothetical protein [Sphingobacterium bovistauri]
MYIGTTTAGRKDHFIVLEKGDDAKSVQELITEKNIKNLIISREIKEEDFLGNPDFKSIFQLVEILHLNKIEIGESEKLYAFQNLKRFEIVDCTHHCKEPIDFLNFTNLEEVVMPYSKRFVNLFNHPKLKMIMLENFNQPKFIFPENNVLETLSIEKSKDCDWSSLTNFNNLISLYLVKVPSLIDISWMPHLSNLKDIELSNCKKVENCIENIANIKTLDTIFLSYMGDFETLEPLKKLSHLKELNIENGGKLTDNKNVDFLFDMPNLEFGIDMRNCKCSDNCVK